ncbi:MAG: UDP-N-acetyl-alpha-D-glucosamine C6 dehydratase [Alphaproteobacteria bacterium MarineAlpha9_Bin7]|nr:MAG: UDP-N-acetyl-alpha-D-glucosamine C6 dehydratase [Alphaproteobacteria bacterium MarineAlpha9_Bin7]
MTKQRLKFDRPYVAALHDIVMATAAFVLSLYLRLGDDFWSQTNDFLLEGTILSTAICASVFVSLRLYRGIWRYASLDDLLAIAKAVSLAVLIFAVAMFALTRLESMPRSALAIYWLLLMSMLGGPRLLYRVAKDRGFLWIFERGFDERVPVLLAGAGDTADAFLRQQRKPGEQYRIVGLIDEDESKEGRYIHGVPVIGTPHNVDTILKRWRRGAIRPQRILIGDAPVTGIEIGRLLEIADRHGMTLARLPHLTDFKVGEAAMVEPRPIAIEDLLGRPQTRLDREAMAKLIGGRRVLITGAGGSIGGELARQVAATGPDRLILLDHGEYNLYHIDREIAERSPTLNRHAVLGDIRDRVFLEQIFRAERPELVFHAAALKHVPLAETNPCEAVLTNVVGTRQVADSCQAFGVTAMVQISTDKAVNPSSVMGASKRLAEGYCQALDRTNLGSKTRYVTVRFGNVLGSTGSVVPLFQRQLAQGGPLTVTHPEVSRYFMTAREAVELVLQASAIAIHMGSAANNHSTAALGQLYVLDMGEPIRIQDLARQIIRLSGLEPDVDIAIKYVGLRAGEKLSEELFHEGESLLPTAHEAIRLANTRPVELPFLTRRLSELATHAETRQIQPTLELLHELVPEYRRDPPNNIATP